LCKAIEPIDPLWIEDPLTVRYSEAWLELKRSTRVPLLAGEKVELMEGFRPYLDNQVLDMIHPDIAYSGGITGCRKIADYAALTRTPMGMHSGPCSLIRFYASMHMGAATQNFFKVANVLGAFRGNKKMAQGPEPAVRKSMFPVPEGPGLGLDLNEDWLRAHVAAETRGGDSSEELPRASRSARDSYHCNVGSRPNVCSSRAAYIREKLRTCHGGDGLGGEMGPNIAFRLTRLTDEQLSELLVNGRPKLACRDFQTCAARKGRADDISENDPSAPPSGSGSTNR